MVAPAVAVVVLDLPPMMTSMPLLLLLRNPFSFLLACRLFFCFFLHTSFGYTKKRVENIMATVWDNVKKETVSGELVFAAHTILKRSILSINSILMNLHLNEDLNFATKISSGSKRAPIRVCLGKRRSVTRLWFDVRLMRIRTTSKVYFQPDLNMLKRKLSTWVPPWASRWKRWWTLCPYFYSSLP